MRRCFSTEPAAPRVVPNAEKKMDGGGVMEESFVAHSEVSAVTRGLSLKSLVEGSRREREEMLLIEGRDRRVERICEPTRPVEPTTAVEVIL